MEVDGILLGEELLDDVLLAAAVGVFVINIVLNLKLCGQVFVEYSSDLRNACSEVRLCSIRVFFTIERLVNYFPKLCLKNLLATRMNVNELGDIVDLVLVDDDLLVFFLVHLVHLVCVFKLYHF